MSRQDDTVFTCPECGTEVVKGASGCSSCGTKLEWDDTDIEPDLLKDERGTHYSSNERRSVRTKLALAACAILAGLEIIFVISAVLSALKTSAIAAKPADVIIDRAPGVLDVASLSILATLITAAAFLMWVHRAFSNLEALDAAPGKYTPKSAVVKFLIPIVNIHQSLKIMSELWRRSGLQSGITAISEQRTYVKEVQSWWTAYIVSLVMGGMSMSSLLPGDWSHRVAAVGAVYCIIHGLTILSAVLMIKIITGIDNRQDAWSKELVLQGKLKPTQAS